MSNNKLQELVRIGYPHLVEISQNISQNKNKKVTEKFNKLVFREEVKSLKLEEFGLKLGGTIRYRRNQYKDVSEHNIPFWVSINPNDTVILLISIVGIVQIKYTEHNGEFLHTTNLIYSPFNNKIDDFLHIMYRFPHSSLSDVRLKKALEVRCNYFLNLKKKWEN